MLFCFGFTINAAQDSQQHRSMTNRPGHKVQSYQLNINGETYPSDLISTRSRMIVELQRAFDTLGTTKSGCGILRFNNVSASSADITCSI